LWPVDAFRLVHMAFNSFNDTATGALPTALANFTNVIDRYLAWRERLDYEQSKRRECPMRLDTRTIADFLNPFFCLRIQPIDKVFKSRDLVLNG